MKSLILLLILAFISPAQAKMSCMDLFNFTRPSQEQINVAIYELAQLLKDKYSKDSSTRLFAKKESEKKFSELMQIMDRSEIKARLLAVIANDTSISAQKNRVQDELVQSGERILDFIEGQQFNSKGQTRLTQALLDNNIDLVKKYLEKGDDPNYLNKNFKSPLGLVDTTYPSSVKMVELLISHGADINHINQYGSSPLMLYLSTFNTAAAMYMITQKPELNVKDIEGYTALLRAIEQGKDEVATALIAAGADVNIANNKGVSPLLASLETNFMNLQSNISYQLLDRGADIHARHKSGESALTTALKNNKYELAQIFIDRGIDINSVNLQNRTALIISVINRDSHFTQILIDKGADFTVKDVTGETALSIAKRGKIQNIVDILVKAGAKE